MQITFKKIDRSNYEQCIGLKVDENQTKFVAPNIFSLVQAAYEPDLYPIGIYDDSNMKGFILYDYDKDLQGWSMSRFMIDKTYQGQGIGKVALRKFIEFFKEQYPEMKRLYTSAEVDNHVAIALYEKAGFQMGEVFEYEHMGEHYREVRMVLIIE